MSILITYARVAPMYEDINTVALSNEWPTISSKDARLMEKVVSLLEPIHDMLLIWEQDGLTISCMMTGVQILLDYYKVRNIYICKIIKNFIEFVKRVWLQSIC